MPKMTYFSQRDPKWSQEKLGESTLTVGRYGCTTCCLSMLSSYFGCTKLPITLAHDVKNYTKDGLIIWKNLSFQKMKFIERGYTRDDAKIREHIANPHKAVILQVDNGSHWVVGVRSTYVGNDYWIVDPWDGKRKTLNKSYRNITGAAYFERT